ncbi:excinuclease ABC subunit A [Rhizobium sp. CRIBSB]|nr:excinuclease ABC subunit A [Rhizobium sp. CRIBSB]
MTPHLTTRWLKLMSLFVVLLGLLVAFGAHPATALPATWLSDIVFWPFDGAQPLEAPAARVLAAISGGVMAGWGAMMWLILDRLMPADPALARLLIIEAVLIWFVVDSTGSFAAGAMVNVLLNTMLMLAFVVPAWFVDGRRVAIPS